MNISLIDGDNSSPQEWAYHYHPFEEFPHDAHDAGAHDAQAVAAAPHLIACHLFFFSNEVPTCFLAGGGLKGPYIGCIDAAPCNKLLARLELSFICAY